MKKYFKKFSALLVAMIMVLTMCVPVGADETEATPAIPSENDTTTVKVENVETGLTVTAYQIVKGSYNDYGFIEFVKANNSLSIENVNAPTSAEVLAIAADINNSDINNSDIDLESVQMTESDGVYSSTEVKAGYWVVIVTGSGSKIYNPMLIGAYYSTEGSGSSNNLIGGSVSADDEWDLTAQPAYAKSSEITLDKKIVNSGSNNPSGDDVAIGDIVSFQVTTQIPEYTSQYDFSTGKDITFTITDTLDKGLKGIKDVEVVVGKTEEAAGTNVTEDDTIVDVSECDDNSKGFSVDFISDEYLVKNAGKSVVITYKSVLTAEAVLNFNANPNKVELKYSNNPGTITEIDDTTYHYTFEINGEIVKVGENDEKLADAEFKLFKAALTKNEDGSVTWSAADELKTAVSDTNGKLVFTGLDAGKYILKESKAPNGYSLSDKETKIEITASYNDDGTLASYKIIADEVEESAVTYTKNVDNKSAIINLPNTKLASLPSTGGMGTYIFTIVGVALMVAAVAILLMKRRNKA